MLTNTVDVVSYDVRDISGKVAVLNEQMVKTQEVMQYMQRDIQTNRIIASTALAFGIIGTAGSIASIGMQLASNGISFVTKNGYQMMSGITSEAQASGYEMFTESVAIAQSTPLSLRSISTDISPVLDWSNQPYTMIPELPYEDECDNPATKATTLHMTIDICNNFRDTLKPLFKLLATRINEMNEEFATVDEINTVLEEHYVQKSDLPPAVDLSGYVLKTEFDALKAENDNLRASIATIEEKLTEIEEKLATSEPKSDLPECYAGFIEQELVPNNYFTFTKQSDGTFEFDLYFTPIINAEKGYDYNYLFIFLDDNYNKHYIRYEIIDLENEEVNIYIDEVYGNTKSYQQNSRGYVIFDIELELTSSSSSSHIDYHKKYSKP